MRYSEEKLGVGKEMLEESVCCDSEEEGSQETFCLPQSSSCAPSEFPKGSLFYFQVS